MSLKDEIKAAIASTQDANMRVAMLMLLGVLDEISTKIDDMRADEAGLRAAVLNGHEPVHHAHHEWIDRQIKYDESNTEHHKWVARKMLEEAEDAKADKEAKRAIRNAIIERLLWAAVVVIVGASGWALN